MFILSNFKELKSEIVRRTSIYFNFSEISFRDEFKFRRKIVHDYQEKQRIFDDNKSFFQIRQIDIKN